MPTGARFSDLGNHEQRQPAVAVLIPPNCVLRIIRDDSDRFINVLCEGRELTIIAVDLHERGQKLESEHIKIVILQTEAPLDDAQDGADMPPC